MYLVTGATGNVGSQVVAQLLGAGKQVRVLVRDRGKAARWGDRIQVAIGDFSNPDSFAGAFADIEAAFLMNIGPDTEPFRRIITNAKSESDPRIVFLSSMFAAHSDIEIGRWHRDKEQAIRDSGLSHTFLRPSGFMTNAYQWLNTIQTEAIVYNAMGAGKYAPIAPEDIAVVATKALTSLRALDEMFDLTGSKLLSVPEQVSILANAIGRPLRCIDVPIETATQGLISAGLPAQIATAIAQSFEAVRNGHAAQINDTVKRVTGHAPKTFEAWAREHASRFS